MKSFKVFGNLGMRTQLILGFLMVIAVLIFSSVITLQKVSATKKIMAVAIKVYLPLYDALVDLRQEIFQSQTALNGYLMNRNSKFKTEISNNWVSIMRYVAVVDSISKNTHITGWENVTELLSQLKEVQLKVENALNDETVTKIFLEEATPILSKLTDLFSGALGAKGQRVGGIYDDQYAKLSAGFDSINDHMDELKLTVLLLAGAGVFISFLVAMFTIRGIMLHVKNFRKYSNQIAKGDLTQRLVILNNDEMGELGSDLNKMTDGLVAITREITEASNRMLTTLSEVNQSIESQSSGAREQASSINEITSSLEEIEKSSMQTMEKAKSLGAAALHTSEKGQQGLEAVEQSVRGMKIVREKVQLIAQTILELSNKTQQVGEITAVVNNLAQQSKMLALNASIEAAKAGDAGKGFAVVAVEVKNLAEQSEQSTAQVQKILEDIRHATEKAVMVTEEGTKGVDEGTNLVEQTGEIVRSLSDVIYETTVSSQQIEAAVRQESIGIEQITAGMSEINQVTASFVESVKQTTVAIENLGVIAQNLKAQIDVYKYQ